MRRLGMKAQDSFVFLGMDRRSAEEKERAATRTELGARTIVEVRRPIGEVVAELNRENPEFLLAYPSILTEYCRATRTGERIRPRVVLCSGETLTESMHEFLVEALGTRVLRLYASLEFGWMGLECEECGEYHVPDAAMILEVLRPDGTDAAPGERGRLVATLLDGYEIPFLRYEIGDWVIQGARPALHESFLQRGPCRSEPLGSTLGRVQGRILDSLSLPHEPVFHAYRLTIPLIASAPWLLRYQVIQESPELVRFLIVTRSIPPKEELSAFEAKGRSILGGQVQFRVEFVEQLRQAESGKFRVVEAAHHYGAAAL